MFELIDLLRLRFDWEECLRGPNVPASGLIFTDLLSQCAPQTS